MFGFTKVDRETYNSTFLRKVIINVKFPFTNQLKEKSKDIIDLFKVDFPRAVLGKNKGFQISIEGKEGQPNFRTIDEDDNISLKTEDGQIELLINCDNIIFSIEGKIYKSYEKNIEVILQKTLKLFDLISINSIINCSIRKINLIEFGYDEQRIPNGILSALLNNSIVYNEDAFNGMDYITQNIHNLEFKDGQYTLNLKYGMNTLPVPDKKIGQLIVDNVITSNSEIGSKEFLSEMKILNEELFNVFFWLFNDDAKSVLRNGQFS